MSARGQTRMTKNENASPSKECLQGLCGIKMFMTLITKNQNFAKLTQNLLLHIFDRGVDTIIICKMHVTRLKRSL